MQSQTQTHHHHTKIPWPTLFIALASITVVVIGSYWNYHTTGDREFQKKINLQIKEVSIEVQKNGKALARIEAILEK